MCAEEKLSWEIFLGGIEDKGHFLGFEIHPLMSAGWRLGQIKRGFDRDQSDAASPGKRAAAVALSRGIWGALLAAHRVGTN